MSRIYLADIPIDILTEEEVISTVGQFINEKKPHHIITINSLICNYSFYDSELKKIVMNSDLVIPDSIGIILACLFFTGIRPARLPGINLIMKLCKFAQNMNYNVYLLGSTTEVIEKTNKNLRNFFPRLKIAGYHHGYFDSHSSDQLIPLISSSKPDILFVALNAPEQEKWINRNLFNLGVPAVIGVGGSFDIISGKLRRAPEFLRKAGLEWFFRVIQQPWRIARIKDLPVFVYNIVRLKYKQ